MLRPYCATRSVALGMALCIPTGCSPSSGPAPSATTSNSTTIPVEIAELRAADSFTLYSLFPGEANGVADGGFHGYYVLGETTVVDIDTRRSIADALQKGIDEHDGSVALCFEPRHGIRVNHAGSAIDFLICFECLQVQRFKDGQPIGGFLISNSPQLVLDEVLRNAGVALADKR